MIIKNIVQLKKIILPLKAEGKKIIWTNGCFDIMHPGHIKTFEEAKKLWDILIVWLNGDKSPYRTTKPGRPIHSQEFRSLMLDSIKYVDYIYIYDEETPFLPIQAIIPDILVKGGDYAPEKIVWYDIVTGHGGKVVTIPTVGGYATTNTIQKILSTYSTTHD